MSKNALSLVCFSRGHFLELDRIASILLKTCCTLMYGFIFKVLDSVLEVQPVVRASEASYLASIANLGFTHEGELATTIIHLNIYSSVVFYIAKGINRNS